MDNAVDMYEGVVYLFDGTTEGLLSAVFASYANHEHPVEVIREQDYQPCLLYRSSFIPTCEEHARRVSQGLGRKRGSSVQRAVLRASLSGRTDAPSVIYRFIRYAMDEASSARRILDDLSHPAVKALHDLVVSVGAECEKIRQFARFQHLKDERGEIWFARINPRDSVVPLVLDHFIERFSIQPFILYDEVHHIAGMWDGRRRQLADVADRSLTLPEKDASEVVMQKAWQAFYRSLSIDERYHPELRRQMMPKRFWRNLTELQPDEPGLDLHG